MKYYGKFNDDHDLITVAKGEQIAQDEIRSAIDPSTGTVQSKLVSGTNIKTINGSSILGSGNVDVGNDVGFSVVNGKLCMTYEGV